MRYHYNCYESVDISRGEWTLYFLKSYRGLALSKECFSMCDELHSWIFAAYFGKELVCEAHYGHSTNTILV